MQASSRPTLGSRLSSPGLCFAVILGAMCLFVLTLPIFPSQDGPMHRYYVHAFDSILQHQGIYSVYNIRHPFPPYATHYLLLLALSHLFPFDLAEKLFVCLTFLCFAFGLRMTAKAVGPAGEWSSLFFAPLLFSWAMMMGFFNYVLGVALVLLATAFWQQIRNGRRLSILWYLLALAVLTFTHPIPLVLLIVITLLDLALGWFFRARTLPSAAWLRQEGIRIVLAACTAFAIAFPALAVDSSSSTTAKTIADTHFKPEFVRTALLLTGISPYNSRSLNVWIDAYRLCLYILLPAALWIGGRAAIRALRERRHNLGCTLFVATLLLAVALPILPNSVNGSWYFSTRMVMVLWPSALIAAGIASAPALRHRPRILAAALAGAVLTLIPAQLFFRPLANQVHAAELTALPTQRQALVLVDHGLEDYLRYRKQVAFNPYEWGSVLPLVRRDDVLLDAPWMDQKIAPLMAAPGSPILLQDVATIHGSKTDPPRAPGGSLPVRYEAEIVSKASLLVYAATPSQLSNGLLGQLTPAEAARFTCTQPQDWYLVCVGKDR